MTMAPAAVVAGQASRSVLCGMVGRKTVFEAEILLIEASHERQTDYFRYHPA